jgi:hypothetical protein
MQCLQLYHRAFQRFIAAAIIVGGVGPTAQAVEIKPYEARVVASGATIQSGPGDKFYPTDTLARGDLVEVYREKPGGWLGIRPTPNSFSWVAARDLNVQEGGLGEVNKDDAASRIGSRLNDKHNASQVRLKRGETVEVLGEEKFGDETWYKIAPPAGEFRWIQSSLVERTGPIQQVSAESTAPAKTAASGSKNDSRANAAAGSLGSNDAIAPPLIPTSPSASPIASHPTPITPPAATTSTATAASVAPPSAAPSASSTATTTDDDLHHALTGIEIRLSRMASAPVNLWNTEGLERDAAQLMNRAQTPADRDAVQATQKKIDQFAAISHRTGAPASAATPAGRSPITPVPGQVAATTANGNPYDAVGILRPVVSRRPGAPQFALVDEHGQVLTFVTPTPDMNLQPYVGRRVGVVGNRGYIAEFNRTHVTAARVTPLSDTILR